MTWRRALVGFGLTTLIVTVVAFFVTDWPHYGRTSAFDYPCYQYPSAPKNHGFVNTSGPDVELFPPGLRCHWRECVLTANKKRCRTQLGPRSRFFPAKATAYLVLLGGSAATALIFSVFGLIWLAVFMGPRKFIRVLRRRDVEREASSR